MTAPTDFSDEELLALLRDLTVSPAAIVEEMEGAGVTPCPPADIDTARAVLESFAPEHADAFSKLTPLVRAPVLDQAVAARAAPFVTALCATADKSVAKEAKRALHRLRAGGLNVEAPRPVAATAAAPAEEQALSAYMSSIDGSHGERIVFHPCPAPGGVDVAQVILSDEHGITKAELVPLARRGYRNFVEKLAGSSTLLFAPVPRAYARSLIARALDRNAVARRPVPPGFNEVAFALGPTPPVQSSPGHDLPVPEHERLLTTEAQARRLLDHQTFSSWAGPDDITATLRARREQALASPLYLDDRQRDEAHRDALREAVLAYWTPERRRLWAERLFDMAWLLHAPELEEVRSIATACARALESETPADEQGFTWALLQPRPAT